jgi:hypothetical protein
MTYGISRKRGTRLVFGLSLLGASQAASARADCTDDLVQQVFAVHAQDPSPDSRVAMHAWLCEGASDAFLSEQVSLPTGPGDLAAWNALFGAIDQDTEISDEPVGPANVTQFRSANCASPSKHFLVHALGRVATAEQFEAWHTCDAAATVAANATSLYYDLDLSCAGRQLPNGNLAFSVRGFSAGDSGVSSPLRNLDFALHNLIPVADYEGAEIAPDESGSFEFEVPDPLSEASIAMTGSAATEYGEEGEELYFFCNLDIGEVTSSSTPYGLPREVECAFEEPRVGTTACPAGRFREECVNGQWQDTTTCVADRLNLTVTTSSQSGASGSVLLPDNTPCVGSCTVQADKLSTVRLRATPASGSRVTWAGSCVLEGNDCLVTMNAATSVSAVFSRTSSLTVVVGGSGSGSVTSPSGETCSRGSTCEWSVDPTRMLELRANPSANTRVTWSGCTPSADQLRCTLPATTSASRTVSVTLTGRVTITAKIAGNGVGEVRMPSGADCFGASCTETVDKGSSVELMAIPDSGNRVTWTGCSSMSGGRCTVSMATNKTVTATFRRVGNPRPPHCGPNSPPSCQEP